jgi:hypothetical protein
VDVEDARTIGRRLRQIRHARGKSLRVVAGLAGRSLADADTHRGHHSIVTRSVHALCGIEFVPRPLPLGGPALPGNPLDPEQVCPQCRTTRASAR